MKKPMLCLNEVYHNVVNKTTLAWHACTVFIDVAVCIDDYSLAKIPTNGPIAIK